MAMSSKKWAILWAFGFSGAGILPAHAAETAQLNVKLGLWEISTHPQISGNLPITDEQLQKLAPEQRAKFEAAMKAALARGAEPKLMKECMTAEKRSRGFDLGDKGSDCKTTVVTNTPSEFESHRECATDNGKQSSSVHFRMLSPDHASGTVNMVISHAEKTMTVNSAMEAKWLGADCGAVKDTEIEKIPR
jgi:hypothetical protein